jgi:hypothetical protein
MMHVSSLQPVRAYCENQAFGRDEREDGDGCNLHAVHTPDPIVHILMRMLPFCVLSLLTFLPCIFLKQKSRLFPFFGITMSFICGTEGKGGGYRCMLAVPVRYDGTGEGIRVMR